MSRKLPGFSNAIGAWSNTWKRVEAAQIPAQVRVWHQDKLITRGKAVSLWRPVDDLTPGVVECTCTKQTTASAQRQCDSCHGVKLIPGYLKFQHQTIFFASAEAASFAFTNVVVNTLTKPNTLQLADGVLTGSFTTQDKPFTNPLNATWEARVDSFLRDVGAEVIVDFSTDAGSSWARIQDINGATQPRGTGSIRFRVTLTRAAVGDASPIFEILRLRRPEIETVNTNLLRQRKDLTPGQLLILKTWAVEKSELVEGRGREILHLADRSWTVPLDFFDTSITRDTHAARIDDSGAGPHPFLEYSDGVQASTRYALEQVSYNTQFGIFTQQVFTERRLQAGEPYHLVY